MAEGDEGFGTFAAELADALDLDATGWEPADLLADRLRWDSLMAMEVVAWLEERGVRLPDDLLGELRTLADLHHYARSLAPAVPAPEVEVRPARTGHRVRLLPLTGVNPSEALDLYLRGDNFVRFRLRGTTPSPEAFARMLWDRVLCQFAVLEAARVVGVVTAFEPDLRNRHVHVAVVTRDDAGKGAGMEGLALLLDHLFAEFDLRKVYAEVLEPNAEEFLSGLGRLATVEGRLVDHEYMDGGYHDMLVVAISRDRWEANAGRLLGV